MYLLEDFKSHVACMLFLFNISIWSSLAGEGADAVQGVKVTAGLAVLPSAKSSADPVEERCPSRGVPLHC